MIDRAIGLIGIAIALLTAAAPSLGVDVPSWITPAGLLLGFTLLGISIGLLLAGGLARKPTVSTRALLRIRIFGDHRTPERIDAESIFRWYFLQNAVNAIGPDGVAPLAAFVTLFVSFEPEVRISTLQIRSPDVALPRYDVREFNQRYAIIQFSGTIPAGTLEISVMP